MEEKLLKWHIYEITTDGELVNGVKLRGRIRKFGITQGFNVLAENATDIENCVRVAMLDQQHADKVISFVRSLIPGAKIELISESVINPVLSKIKVNLEDRYEI